MKNIFKLMGIAVLACGIMAACGGKDNDINDTTPDTPQPQPEQAVFSLKWDNAEQTLGYKSIIRDNEQLNNPNTQEPIPVIMVESAHGLNGDSYEFPAFVNHFIYVDASTCYVSDQVTLNYNGQQVSAGYFFPNEVYETGGIEYNDYTYGDYQICGINTPLTMSVDATALKLTASVNLKFGSFEELLNSANQSWDEVTTFKNEELTISNYSFADGSIQK